MFAVWYGVVWCAALLCCCYIVCFVLCCGMKWVVMCCDVLLWYDVFCCVGYDVLWCGVVCSGMVWCGVVLCVVLWYLLCVVWDGVVWCDVFVLCCIMVFLLPLVLPVEFTVRYYRILSNPTILHVYNCRFLVDSFAHQNQPSFVDILSFLWRSLIALSVSIS